MPALLVLNGEVRCPLKQWAGIARDACCARQAREGLGCGFGCERGALAMRQALAHREEEQREEKVREKVRARHAAYYERYGHLPSQQKVRTGKPPGRPRKPRAPVLPGSEWWR